ncbi:MAG: sulfatase-like hydrolase/transferase [Arenicellales bacterium]
MSQKDKEKPSVSRREFLESAGLSTLALASGALPGTSTVANAAQATAHADESAGGKPFNILFILTDQERYFDPAVLPDGYLLPGRERLRREGVTFTDHQIATSVCSSSRSVIYTGQHIQQTGVFDNLDFPWASELPSEMPTVGSYMTDAGYYSAYLGKCHFIKEFEETTVEQAPDVNMSDLNLVMREYGFNDFVGIGDIIGMTMGGYHTDEFTTSTATRWLRAKAPELAQQGMPWFLSVNLVNPHDVMFFNTDAPDTDPVQDKRHLMGINRAPAHSLYQRSWDMPLPVSRTEHWNAPGRPRAHYEYQFARQSLVGQFPNEDARWQRLQDYYLNCIADSDQHVDKLLDELDQLGLADNTIVVMTSDHGELGGAHQMHGKGATAYREQLHVPVWIRHPGHAASAGKTCQALTSHLDITPTILGLAGVSDKQRHRIAPQLKGRDFSSRLASPESSGKSDVRGSALYNFNMWAYQDAKLMDQVYDAQVNGQNPKELGLKPNLTKRGAIRSVTDGHYRFSRYFSPLQHNLPETMEQILKYNDIELYDLQADPHEMRNLAVNTEANGDLLLTMNQKLTDVISAEVGDDDGSFLPENKSGWAITRFDP